MLGLVLRYGLKILVKAVKDLVEMMLLIGRMCDLLMYMHLFHPIVDYLEKLIIVSKDEGFTE